MRQFCDVLESHLQEIVQKPGAGCLGDQYSPILPKPSQCRTVEVVPMQMRDKDKIGVQALEDIFRDGRIIPPGAPVCASNKPWITYKGLTVRLNLHARMAQDGKSHRLRIRDLGAL